MKKLVLGLAVLAGVLFVAWKGYLLYFDFEIKPAPPEVTASENALVSPELIALASADVAHMVDLDSKFRGKQEDLLPPDAEEDPSVLADLIRAGVNPRKSISHALAGLYLTEKGDMANAIVLHGQFAAERIASFIEARYVTEQLLLSGVKVLKFYKEDKNYCEPPGHWVIALEPTRIVLMDPAIAETLMARMQTGAAAAQDLGWWHHFRSSHLAGGVLFIPHDRGTSIANPLLRAPVQTTNKELSDFHSLYLGAKVRPLPPALNLTLWMATVNDDAASATLERWRNSIVQSKDQWTRLLPTVAELYDAIDISMKNSTVIVQANLGQAWLDKLGEIPAEIVSTLFGGAGFEMPGQKSQTAQEQLQQHPLVYQPEYGFDNLADYDPGAENAGPVDTVNGPFGARIERISLSDYTGIGLELDIKGFSTNIGNLGREHKRARMVIKEVITADGTDLLLDEPCGPTRNNAGISLETGFHPLTLSGLKPLRLRPSAKMTEIKEIIGHFELDLPVKTESVLINSPQPGIRVEQAGVRLNITQASDNAVSYNYSGKTKNLIEVRALNQQGKPLQQQSAFGGDMFLSNGQFRSVHYAGKIAQLEMIFAAQTETKEYPFTVSGNKPTPVSDQVTNNNFDYSFIGLAAIRQQYGNAAPPVPDEMRTVKAAAKAGPFTVILNDIHSFGSLQPRITVLAPDIPNVKETLSSVVLDIKQIYFRNGQVYEPAKQGADRYRWLIPLPMSQAYGKNYLFNSFSIDSGLTQGPTDVTHILGEITFFTPTAVDSFRINRMELGYSQGQRGVDVMIHALHRDKIELRSITRSERILRVRAFNEQNQELWVTSPAIRQTGNGWQGTFSLYGAAKELEIEVPHTVSRSSYPFTLRLP